MDQHPIPQDVTGFQFKLIGSMTVKQFGFVAAGVIMAVIMYYLPIQGIFALPIKMLLIPLFGAGGVIIAFVPVEGRPADVMAANFIKALFAPNQYIYKRAGRQLSFSKITTLPLETLQAAAAASKAAAKTTTTTVDSSRGARLEAFLLESSGSQSKNDLDKKELAFVKNISMAATPVLVSAQPVQVPAATPVPVAKPQGATIVASVIPSQATVPTPSLMPTAVTPGIADHPTPPPPLSEEKPEDLAKEEATLQQELVVAKQIEKDSEPKNMPISHERVLDLEKKIQQIHQEKEQLEQELLKMKGQMPSAQPTTSPAPSDIGSPELSTQAAPPGVRVVPQAAQRSAGLPHIPDTPNVVVGIVKDPRGNVLNNILVEIKDKDNNPVRAFKTNALGHFASATPLATGIYTIELEDPKKQNRFDHIQLVANNQILLPLEIVSHDAREELRKQLFN